MAIVTAGACLAAGCESSGSTSSRLATRAASAVNTAPLGTSAPAATSIATTASGPPPVCPPTAGGNSSGQADLTAVDVHNDDGNDVLVFTFTTPGGGALTELPAWKITSQGSAAFQLDPSGLPTTIGGAAGLKVVFNGGTAYDVGLTPPVRTYTGPTRITPQLKEIVDVEQIGDFERVLSWGVGLAAVRCASVTVSSTQLTIKLPANT